MDLLQSLALAGGMAWASGMRLYAVLFVAGLLSRLGYLELPPSLSVLDNPWIMGLSGFLLLVEFLADKIPVVDSVWDALQSFIRIPSGALLAALALGNHDPAWMVAAGLLGGTLTAGTFAAKAGGRAIINASPEPFSNIAASLGEDALVASGLWAAVFHPLVFLILLGFFVIALVWIVPRVWRSLGSAVGRVSGWFKAS
jgi:hypothetical protein